MNKKLIVALSGVLLFALFGIAAYLLESQKTAGITEVASDPKIMKRYYSPTMGPSSAQVTIVEFFDPACETCRKFHPYVKQLMESNPGRVNIVMRYAPFHPGSDYIVKLLEAAKLQNLFWETLEATYESQPFWAQHGNPQPQTIWQYLGGVGLDIAKVKEDMQSQRFEQRIQQDLEDASALQVTKTPTFFVNGKPLSSFGYRQLKALVESEISENYQM
ncbi:MULTISPECIES: DsbA family protein [Marinomonas]|jgi:protein-disulfide isomerase|uniref:Thioredoxin n=1 Tax=Marinomonas fungiae TaxID=1137284 RepID=A0A0K6ITS9_9GAMM|nr:MULTISPECIES: thioredoxin domain-containing protein [Marinomonas]CUB06727.1 Thioredoxin [Marinomonas fungiae]